MAARRSATSNRTALFQLLTNIRVMLAAGVAAMIGLGLLYAADLDNWAKNLVLAIGGAFLAAGTVTLLWELGGRRAFALEVLARVELAHDAEEARLLHIYRGLDRIDFRSLLDGARTVDLALVFNQTWWSLLRFDLEQLSRSRTTRIRLVLPDPDSGPVVEEISKRFGMPAAGLRNRITEARDFFCSLQQLAERKDSVQIFLLGAVPMYSYLQDRLYGSPLLLR
ncbi:MAG: hypothetical protein V3S38_06970 [Acidimicrobiia bacterium]